jgi:hypothetical protein
MKKIVQKLVEIEKETSKEKGEYDLFALFLREGSVHWDIVVSAKWVSKNKWEALTYLSKKVQDILNVEEIVQISHIAILDHNLFEVPEFLEDISVQHGSAQFKDEEFSGQQIERGYVITVNSNQAA